MTHEADTPVHTDLSGEGYELLNIPKDYVDPNTTRDEVIKSAVSGSEQLAPSRFSYLSKDDIVCLMRMRADAIIKEFEGNKKALSIPYLSLQAREILDMCAALDANP